jgi:hypothetical protein
MKTAIGTKLGCFMAGMLFSVVIYFAVFASVARPGFMEKRVSFSGMGELSLDDYAEINRRLKLFVSEGWPRRYLGCWMVPHGSSDYSLIFINDNVLNIYRWPNGFEEGARSIVRDVIENPKSQGTELHNSQNEHP